MDPRRPASDLQLFEKFFELSSTYAGHFWIASSGSSATADLSTKLVGLSKEAVLASARAVNHFLEVSEEDVWGLTLPTFHVGGLGVEARAFLGGNRVERHPEWDPGKVLQWIEYSEVSLLSLVPTQIFDLVRRGARCPERLRAVVVGGAALDPLLYAQARQLGWPILPSYGMTECSSQIATAAIETLASPEFPALTLLPHWDYQIDGQGQLGLRGKSLMTGFWQAIRGEPQFFSHPPQEFWTVPDLVEELHPGSLRVKGRKSEFVKILGEGVSIPEIQGRLLSSLEESHHERVQVVALPDPRKGSDLVVAYEAIQDLEPQLNSVINAWNESCLPVERIRGALKVTQIPRSALGKVLTAELEQILFKAINEGELPKG